VTFLGYREDVPALMARASVHCCPSLPAIREAFGLVVLEAKAAGLPSIVTRSGNLGTLVDHRRTGWVCREATAADLAEGLGFFLLEIPRAWLPRGSLPSRRRATTARSGLPTPGRRCSAAP
jgi:glycosyltransferase involved in cell wall biosynthesis